MHAHLGQGWGCGPLTITSTGILPGTWFLLNARLLQVSHSHSHIDTCTRTRTRTCTVCSEHTNFGLFLKWSSVVGCPVSYWMRVLCKRFPTWRAWCWSWGCLCRGLWGSTWWCRSLYYEPGGRGHTTPASYSKSACEGNSNSKTWLNTNHHPGLLSLTRISLTFKVMSSEQEASSMPDGSHLMALTSFCKTQNSLVWLFREQKMV